VAVGNTRLYFFQEGYAMKTRRLLTLLTATCLSLGSLALLACSSHHQPAAAGEYDKHVRLASDNTSDNDRTQWYSGSSAGRTPHDGHRTVGGFD
jgi:hypothetical protein